MIRTVLLVWTSAIAAIAQQPAAPPKEKPAFIALSVISEATGAPVPNASVTYTAGTLTMGRTSDAQGRVRLENLTPARYTVTAAASGGLSTAKRGELTAGQDLSLQLKVALDGQISGRILDQNSDPLPNIAVYLVTREYSLGSLRYIYSATTRTNDKGEYVLERAHPGISYLLLAAKEQPRLDAVSTAPADPKFRRPVLTPTYYPNLSSPEGAPTLKLRDGERRENVDIHLIRSANYCVEGMLPGAARFELREKWPVNTFLVGRSTSGVSVPSGAAGPDGKIRICDLHSGDYEFAAYPAPASGDLPESFSRTIVSIADRDLSGVAVVPTPRVSIPGEIAWDGPPPPTPGTAKLQVIVSPIARAFGRLPATMAAIPGPFPLDLLMDEDSLDFGPLPAGTYIKDVEYGGRSIFHQVFRPGTATGEVGLRVIVAANGGTIAAKVADKDGNPVPDLRVVVMSKSAVSEAALSAGVLSGQADGLGAWTSPVLAPGKYYILATSARVDMTPESIAQLWRARDHATEIDLAPRGAPQVTLVPIAIE